MSPEELINKAQKERFEGNNLIEAERLFLQAANMGSGHAAHELGVLYITGGSGVIQDSTKSQYWLEKSLDSGFEETVATDPTWFRKDVSELNNRLYIGNITLHFSTFEEAKNEAEKLMHGKPELRIEILTETEGADFWAYEYENKQWVPS
ncbi:MAG: hypothetical protein JAY97_01695 [Candidatus Thiodiazotropha sp. 'RUGA']|nr:hypothetical protein [Candidatus Thiodiazotropha sp. 'RUGA']